MSTPYRVELPYACFLIEVGRDGRIDQAAPIGKWMLGKRLSEVARWCKTKGGQCQPLPKVENAQ